jgi:hypothetical protein
MMNKRENLNSSVFLLVILVCLIQTKLYLLNDKNELTITKLILERSDGV